MNILCLMPTYGRPKLVENAIACFFAQDYPAKKRRLLILDDAAQIDAQSGDSWDLISKETRYPSLTAKYNAMLYSDGILPARDIFDYPIAHSSDAIAIMDDDDIYGPQWLSSHAAALQNAQWSHPRQVWSLHRPPATGPDQPGLEPAGGRFWAAAAVRLDLLRRMGGFLETSRATFDQEHLAKWKELGGEPGRPDDFAVPSYCYGWGRSNHCSGRMGSADWYQQHGLMEAGKVEKLLPKMDEQTKRVYEVFTAQATSPACPRVDYPPAAFPLPE